MDNIVEHLRARKGEPRRQAPNEAMKMLLSEADARVIAWRAGGFADQEHGHWEIRYQEADGATRTSRAGLGVTANSQEAPHGDDDYILQKARATLRIARCIWKFRDESGAPRLVSPPDDTQ